MRAGHPAKSRPPGWGLAVAVALVLPLTVATAAAQTLPLKERPAPASLLCTPSGQAPVCSPVNRQQVDDLVNAATRAMIIGDLAEASRLLTRALELDACAGDAAYLLGRVVAQQEGPEPAARWFCRYVTLSPFGASAPDARRQLAQAVEAGAGAELRAEFSTGVALYLERKWRQAEEQFTAVLDRQPVPEAVYNRALARIAMGRTEAARSDLTRYLELRPESEDRLDVEFALQQLAQGPRGPSPLAAFALGAVFPGAGQYYTGRLGFGLAVTGLVAGAAAAGYYYERTTILCRDPTPTGDCPVDAVSGRETERPLLTAALATGLGIMLISAVEAGLHARKRPPPAGIVLGPATLRVDLAARPGPVRGSTSIRLLRIMH